MTFVRLRSWPKATLRHDGDLYDILRFDLYFDAIELSKLSGKPPPMVSASKLTCRLETNTTLGPQQHDSRHV